MTVHEPAKRPPSGARPAGSIQSPVPIAVSAAPTAASSARAGRGSGVPSRAVRFPVASSAPVAIA